MPGRAAAPAAAGRGAAPAEEAEHEDTVVVEIPAEAAQLATAEVPVVARAEVER
jgi:hypothetical protein